VHDSICFITVTKAIKTDRIASQLLTIWKRYFKQLHAIYLILLSANLRKFPVRRSEE